MKKLGLWILVTMPSLCGLAAAADVPSKAAEGTADDDGHYPRAAGARAVDAEAGGRSSGYRGGTTADWQALGPAGGEVTDVTPSPTAAGVVLAATPAGVYRSADGGDTWERVGPLALGTVSDLEFAPGGTAYAGSIDSVWESGDDGVTWTQQDLGIGINDQVLDVAVDPNDASTLWAGISDALGAQTVNVMRSTNGGATWSSVTPPLASPISCTAIAINPKDSDEVFAVFAGFGGGGQAWFTDDGGTTWFNRSAGLPDLPLNDVVHDGSRVLVGGGQLFGSQFVGLYASSNDGVTWTPLHNGTWPLLVVNDVDLDPGDPDAILVATAGTGVHRSTDGGTSWDLGIGGTSALAVLSARFVAGGPLHGPARLGTDVIFLGTSSLGVFRSTDGGAGFGQSSTGISLLDVNSVAANPGDAGELAAAFEGLNDGGVFSTTDGGASWSLEPVPPTRYKTVRFAPSGTLYAISDGPSSIAPEGVYRREANGTWTSLGPDQGGLFESRLDPLRFSVNDPELILTGGQDFGVAGFEPTIWRSIDAGANWDKVYESIGSNGTVSDLEIVEDGTDGEMVASFFFGSPDPGGVLRSIDGGASWSGSQTGLPVETEGASLCAPSGDADTFYLADRSSAAGGLHRSTDRGQTWESTGFTGAQLEEVVCDPTLDEVLYVAPIFTAEIVLRSDDGGASFDAFDDGLDDAGAVRALDVALGPAPRLLFASSLGSFATSIATGLVFADGFESGDTSSWSSTTTP